MSVAAKRRYASGYDLDGDRPRYPVDFVLDEDLVAPNKEAQPAPNLILAHVYSGQTAGWNKMPLGTEIDLGPVTYVVRVTWGSSSP